MADSNLYVSEVRGGIILFFNQETEVADGWWWGTTDEVFVAGPFESSELAVEDARRHSDKPLNLIRWTEDNFLTADKPSPSGNLIVIDTGGYIWATNHDDKNDVREILAELEAEGLIRRRFRRNPETGEMEPVYIITKKGKREFEERMAHKLGAKP
jgi:hypothetical protein